MDNPHRERMTALHSLLLAYQETQKAREVSLLPWTARRLRLVRNELTALQRGEIDTANRFAELRARHDSKLGQI
jgi:glucose-6-phosphate dehydrogenase assembly protein OpcA